VTYVRDETIESYEEYSQTQLRNLLHFRLYRVSSMRTIQNVSSPLCLLQFTKLSSSLHHGSTRY